MTPIEQHVAPGTIVGDRYRVEALLGQGGFGAVYRATQLTLDRPVALKFILPEALGDGGRERFLREAEIVQRLEHPNIVRLLDFGGAATGQPFLVFELLQGHTLDEALRAGGPLPTARVARIAAQVLKALMEAHARAIVHRDIKPANVFLCNFQGEPDYVKLLDFGIAKGSDGSGSTLTQRGNVIGTPAYMAPEQLDGREATFASDLFALGLVMAELVTARPVYAGASLVEMIREHLSPSPVPHAPETLQSPLGPVIHRATQKVMERRYPSAAEMLAHIDAVVAYGMPVSARASGPGVSSQPPAVVPPSIVYAPTSAPVVPPIPLVPPAPPPARTPRKRGGKPWALIGAIGGGAALIGGALAAVLAATGSGSKKGDAPAAAPSGARAEEAVAPRNVKQDGLAEAHVNGDGVLDIVTTCEGKEPSLCAFDGASFRPLWRRPLTNDVADGPLAAAGRSVAVADSLGLLHVYDVATGAPQGTVRLGKRVDHLCAPTELPGKLWIRFRDNRGGTVDLATRAVAESASRPSSCVMANLETYCDPQYHPQICAPTSAEPESDQAYAHQRRVEGANGVAVGSKKSDQSVPMILGFTPQPRSDFKHKVVIRWQRPVAPGDGLSAVRGGTRLDLLAGRALTDYADAAGTGHIVVVDAATGRTLWDAASPHYPDALLTPTRVYVGHNHYVEVRDAATGRLLGTVGEAAP